MEPEDLKKMNVVRELCLNESHGDCIKAANDILDYQPNNIIPLLYKGISLTKQKRYTEAEDTLTLAINLDSTIARFWALRGDVYINTKQYSKAFSDYWNYLQFDPKNSSVLTSCASCLFYIGEDDLTFNYLERAIEIGDNWDSYCVMIFMLKKVGFSGFTEYYYKEALNKFPDKKDSIDEIMFTRCFDKY